MSPRHVRVAQYSDVAEILDAALAAGGGEYELETHGQAVHWQQRAYRFRKLYAAHIAPEPSPYDKLTLPRIPADSATVLIRINRPKGVFRAAAPTPDFDAANKLFDSDLI